jgi:hypothetical protein
MPESRVRGVVGVRVFCGVRVQYPILAEFGSWLETEIACNQELT